MMESALDYEKRPARHANRDGIAEMGIGLLFIAMTLLGHFSDVAASTSIWHSKYTVLSALVVLVLLNGYGTKLLKERVTFRRTGYVKYRYSKWKAMLAAIAGMAVAGAVMIALRQLHGPPREATLIALNGLMWAALYAYFFVYLPQMHQLWRWGVVAALAVSQLVVYLAFRNVPDISNLSLTVVGGCWLVSGIISFCLYLRANRRHEADSADDLP